MPSDNIIQFIPLYKAIGARVNYDTLSGDVTVVEYPEHKKGLVDAATKDINLFLNTQTPADILLFWSMVDFIDNDENPLKEQSRLNILEQSGIMRDGLYIAQSLAGIKTNKSWHTSPTERTCDYFGEECTHRGITQVEGKRGRKATRKPNEYHKKNSYGVVAREQLATASVEALYRAIPQEVVTSATRNKRTFSVKDISSMNMDELAILKAQIEELEKSLK